MPIDKAGILADIEMALNEYERVVRNSYDTAGDPMISLLGTGEELATVLTRLRTVLDRYAPPQSGYLAILEQFPKGTPSFQVEMAQALAGSVKTLRADYHMDRLSSFKELVHADVFADFLEMAEYLLDEEFKDPAAVLAGSVLEEHLRKLCEKNGVPVSSTDKRGKLKPLMIDQLNIELVRKQVYGKVEQQQITAWASIRNQAAHGHYSEYDKAQVTLMLQGIRDFVARRPA
jgi:hypothetical protein